MATYQRRIFPNVQTRSSSTHLLLRNSTYEIKFEIKGRLSVWQRRSLAVTIARDLSRDLLTVNEARIHHVGADYLDALKESRRPVSILRAPSVKTPTGTIGYIIRMRRLALGLTQAELAKIAKIQRTHLSKVERGGAYPQIETTERLEQALQVPLPHLKPFVIRKTSKNKVDKRTFAHERPCGLWGPPPAEQLSLNLIPINVAHRRLPPRFRPSAPVPSP